MTLGAKNEEPNYYAIYYHSHFFHVIYCMLAMNLHQRSLISTSSYIRPLTVVSFVMG
jgi:hypothetical protein